MADRRRTNAVCLRMAVGNGLAVLVDNGAPAHAREYTCADMTGVGDYVRSVAGNEVVAGLRWHECGEPGLSILTLNVHENFPVRLAALVRALAAGAVRCRWPGIFAKLRFDWSFYSFAPGLRFSKPCVE